MKLVFVLLIFLNSCGTATKQESQQLDSLDTETKDQMAIKKELPKVEADCEKCDIAVVRKTEEQLSSLSDDLLGTFLCSFDKKCYSNVEYTEYSNEVLYKVLVEHPQKLVKAIESIEVQNNGAMIIYSEISSPLLDYDYDDLITTFQETEGNSTVKKAIIDALRKAKEG
ncbi:HVA22/TB2/DP1 family protein [Roseivirga pacifica]|uniref:hypothetical protein n=1 Tax=Roseivirga pacifica TaxID=1267423 RepID=UPI00227B0C60|nr:hypothetical protein [Roseivirga pacifica]